MLNTSFTIRNKNLPHRLIQGPLAGFSCAPFRTLFSNYYAPAYCVSEMISANDVLYKHKETSRYIYRDPNESILCYQLAGHDAQTIATAAKKLAGLGADLIDLNCGCPKAKIRKKLAGSALLDDQNRLIEIVRAVRDSIDIPFSVKIRIQGDERDIIIANAIEKAGADALIVHGRRWIDDYDIPCDFYQISKIKQSITIPVIANGDIATSKMLQKAINITKCDAYMVSRAGTGQPWLYQTLLNQTNYSPTIEERINNFMWHLEQLSVLENDHKAVLQSKALARYYFKSIWDDNDFSKFFSLNSLSAINNYIKAC